MGTQLLLNSSRRYVLAGAIAALTMTSGVNGLAQDKAAGQLHRSHPRRSRSRRCRASSSRPGRSTVLTTDFDVTRIALTNPAVAMRRSSRRARF